MSSDRIEFTPVGDDAARLHDFQKDMLDRLGSMFGLPYAYFAGDATMTRAEAEQRVQAYRDRYSDICRLWDETVLQAAVNNAAFFVSIRSPRDTLRMWRWEVGKTITMRQFRRLRGHVKAGKPIAEPPAMFITFDHPPRRHLAPFVSPLGA